MERPEAIDLLPETYAEALRLHDAGHIDLIPERLGIAAEAVGPLLRLAEAKLAALLVTEDSEEAEPRDRSSPVSRPAKTQPPRARR